VNKRRSGDGYRSGDHRGLVGRRTYSGVTDSQGTLLLSAVAVNCPLCSILTGGLVTIRITTKVTAAKGALLSATPARPARTTRIASNDLTSASVTVTT